MRVILPSGPDAVLSSAGRILAREITRRIGNSSVVIEDDAPERGDIVLALSQELGPESFQITIDDDSVIRVSGGDSAGVLYGCGKLLRSARFDGNTVLFHASGRVESPKHPARGMYFATHFYNYYHNAPISDICAYIEELALWGVNALIVWFDMHHYTGIADQAAQEHLLRLRNLHAAARSVGMQVGVCVLGNEAYANSPEELRADQSRMNVAGYGVELCPSKPEGLRLIEEGVSEVFDQFPHLDFIWIWPYDTGGCGCGECQPWGAKGFLLAGEAISKAFRARWPGGKVILSTWLFDYPGNCCQGEWEGLFRRLDGDLEWADMILADGHEEFPRPPLERELPRGLPMVSFPEISMLGMAPWGGYGVNPLPNHWQKMWDIIGERVIGSFPYSEGLFEDINKVIWAQLNWSTDRRVLDIMREYCAYEFSPKYADQIAQAMQLMEKGHFRHCDPGQVNPNVKLVNPEYADGAWAIISDVDSKLPESVRLSWRWRLVCLRAQIDAELKASGGRPSRVLRRAFDEIWQMYHAEERTRQNVRPIRYADC